MSNNTRPLLLVGGVANLGVALMHFVMPLDGALAGTLAPLSPVAQDFVLLLVLATGWCLAVFGAMAIVAARSSTMPNEIAGYVALAQSILWFGRLALEIALPVRLPLFGIATPSPLVMALAAMLAALFLAAYRQTRRASPDHR